jgi:hypothetical protein
MHRVGEHGMDITTKASTLNKKIKSFMVAGKISTAFLNL